MVICEADAAARHPLLRRIVCGRRRQQEVSMSAKRNKTSNGSSVSKKKPLGSSALPKKGAPDSEKIADRLHALLPDLEALYKDIHSHPELSMQEKRTAGI